MDRMGLDIHFSAGRGWSTIEPSINLEQISIGLATRPTWCRFGARIRVEFLRRRSRWWTVKHVKVQNGNLYRYLLDPFGKIVAGKLSFLTCSIHLQIVSCDSLKCGVGVSHPKIDPTSFNMIHFITLRFLTWWCATEHLSGMVSCSMHPLSQWLLLGSKAAS